MKKTAAWITIASLAGIWSACSGDGSKGGPSDATTGGDGGMGGGTSSLELVSRWPDRNGENVWTRAPIELEFSHALDESTVSAAIELESQGEALPFKTRLDEAGNKLRVTLEEVPPLPARVTVKVGSSLRAADGRRFRGESWAWEYPLWQAPPSPGVGADGAEGLGLTVFPAGDVVVAYGDGSGIHVLRLEGNSWTELAAPEQVNAAAKPRVLGAFGAEPDDFTVVWLEVATGNQSLHAARYDGSAWQILGGGPAATGSNLTPSLRFGADGAVVVAYRSSPSAIGVLRAEGDGWEPVGPDLPAGASELSLALDDSGAPLVAFVDGEGDLHAAHLQGGSWVTLGDGIDRHRTSGSASPDLVWFGDAPVLAYLDGDEVSLNVQVARFDGGWQPLGAALDVELDAEASEPRLFVDGERLIAGWREKYGKQDRVFVARQRGEGWQVLGGSPGAAQGATALALGVDGDDNVHVGWMQGAAGGRAVELRRFNGSPVLPSGLSNLGSAGSCSIPTDDDPNFPETLTATGCYENVARQRLVAGAVPFTINSPLWSDGAAKRRYLVLPEKDGKLQTIDYVSAGSFNFPVGSILIKEFFLERVVGDPSTVFPVETRFLVKRCEEGACSEPWQGYSYQWNAAGTEGTLLNNLEGTSKTWAVSDGGTTRQHVHLYPSRMECVLCHNEAAGRALGLQSKQLNRSHDYGHAVDNQLRAWIAAGLFDDAAPSGAPESLARLPQPGDVGRSLEERTRSYFHTNCAHCHRPNGNNVAIDFRYEAPFSATNICNKLVPGDHEGSDIWIRDKNRGDATPGPMPPLATELPDERQLSVTAAWIDSLPETCP